MARIQRTDLSREQIARGLQLARLRETVIELPPLDGSTTPRWADTAAFAAEAAIAEDIAARTRRVYTPLRVPAEVWGSTTPDESQRAALELAAAHGVLILTGGPGVGKTYTAKALLAMYTANGLHITCCAPTGKAALRMKEQTGHSSATIHRTIGLRPDGEPAFSAHEKLPTDVLVLDETSMVDVGLFAMLLAACAPATRLLIIGDADQLPSIGPGRVLYDLLEAGVPSCRLTQIHRQASESYIPYLARGINTGRVGDLTAKQAGCALWAAAGASDCADKVVQAVASFIPARLGFQPADIQVIAAQYGDSGEGGIAPEGIVGLNYALQRVLNRTSATDDENGSLGVRGGRRYLLYIGDKVVQTRNDYNIGVMNGEIGIVLAADPHGLVGHVEPRDGAAYHPENWDAGKQVLLVDFGGRLAYYRRDMAWDLDLAYCISVHKSQGSQAPCVVFVAPPTHKFMLTRSLVYTAVTRAEKFLLLIGAEQTFKAAANVTRGSERRTTLQAQFMDRRKDSVNANVDESGNHQLISSDHPVPTATSESDSALRLPS